MGQNFDRKVEKKTLIKNLFVLDYDEYLKIIDNFLYQSDESFVKLLDAKQGTETFVTSRKDNYAIYLKNMHYLKEANVQEFKAVASWEEEVDKTRTEEQCEWVTEYVDVTKTKTEQQCEKVTKNKQVQKSKPVTKTKQVKKFRTETKCD